MTETCFIVDDEPIEVLALEKILHQRFPDLKIYTATGGSQLFKLLDQYKPDIMLIDIRMPGINGLDLVKEVKEMYPKVQVTIISAHEYFEYAQRAIELGVKKYLVKPARRSEVIDSVNEMIKEVQKQKNLRNEKIHNKERVGLTDYYLKRDLVLGVARRSLDQNDFDILIQLFKVDQDEAIIVLLKYEDRMVGKRLNELRDLWNLKFSLVMDEVYQNYHLFLFFYKQPPSEGGELKDYLNESLIQFKGKYNEEIAWVISAPVKDREQFYYAFEKAHSEIEGSHSLQEKVVNYIHSNYHRDLKLDEVADIANFSSYYFSKWFKKNFHKNFSEYIQELRVNRAQKLLDQTDLSVKEVSYRTGFNDPNYFSRIFKKITGRNPTDRSL